MSVVNEQDARRPLALVVSGETRRHAEVLRKLLLPELVRMLDADTMDELLGIVQHGAADAVVVDSDRDDQELLMMLRLIRRVNWAVPVILVARDATRRFLEGALRLEAFSIAHKPLEREELLMQLRRVMERYYPLGQPDLDMRPTLVSFGRMTPQAPAQTQPQEEKPRTRRTFYFRITHFRHE
jgi:DNA-binding NtrC family response regulator